MSAQFVESDEHMFSLYEKLRLRMGLKMEKGGLGIVGDCLPWNNLCRTVLRIRIPRGN